MANEVIAILLLGWMIGMVTSLIIEALCQWYARHCFKDSEVPTWKEMYLAERSKK